MPTRKYLNNRTANRKCRLNGILPSTRMPKKEKLRKKFSSHIVYSDPQLPHKVNLRYGMTKVEDQADIGSWYVLNIIVLQAIEVSCIF